MLGRKLAALPVALFSAACTMRPWTPAVSVAYWSEPVPAPVTIAAASQPEAFVAWQLPPTNPWARWEKMTLLASLDPYPRSVADLPDVHQLEIVAEAQAAARKVAAAGLPADTLWLVDLRGAASVAFGSALSKAASEHVAVIPTFNNWPADDELVPAEETLAAMIALPPQVPPSDAALTRPVFLLDAWRLAYRGDEPDEGVTDNRYMLSPQDLPDVDTLRAQGIGRVVYVVADLDDTDTEEDDLHEAFMAYQAAGISIFMVDLQFAARDLPAGAWGDMLAPHRYVVSPRVTVCSDIHFYARSRGGFGGVHGFPSGGRGGIGGFGGARGGFGG